MLGYTHPWANIPLDRHPLSSACWDTHPLPSACWDRHGYCCRWYASYWNAFLLPPAMKLGQGYVFTGMCDSVHRGVSASVHAGIPPGSRHPPWEQTPPRSRHSHEETPPGSIPPGSKPPHKQTPPGADTPLGSDTPQSRPPLRRHPLGANTPLGVDPPAQSMLGDTVNARAVRILLECNLVYNCLTAGSLTFHPVYPMHCNWRCLVDMS